MPVAQEQISEVDRVEAALTALFRWGNLTKVRERFRARLGLPIDRAAYAILRELDLRGPRRLSELARDLGIDVSTASRQVVTLEREGLATRSTLPGDRRCTVLEVSARGHRTLARVRQGRKAFVADLLEGWPPHDREALARLLERLVTELVERTEGER
jgi:DNA-binding MarR family transcriptional regulator